MSEFKSITSIGELRSTFVAVGFLISKEQQGWNMFKQIKVDRNSDMHTYIANVIDYENIYKHSKVLLKRI